MAYKFIESFCEGRLGDPELCEDVLVLTPDFAAVVDGVTDKSGRRYAGRAGGRWGADTVAEAITQLPRDLTVQEALEQLLDFYNDALDAVGRPPAGEGTPAANFVMYSDARHEIWRVGDASYMAGGIANIGSKLIDHVHATQRGDILRALLAEGATVAELLASDPGHEAIVPGILGQHQYANRADHELGYPVFNGDEIPSRFIEVIPVPPGATVVLASDGYPILHESLAETEHELARAVAEDPLCIGVLAGTKGLPPGRATYDDRAYIRLLVC